MLRYVTELSNYQARWPLTMSFLPDRRARGSSNEAPCSLAGPQPLSLRPGMGRNQRGILRLATLAEFDLSIINRACGNDLRPSEKQHHTRGGSIGSTHDEEPVSVGFGWC